MSTKTAVSMEEGYKYIPAWLKLTTLVFVVFVSWGVVPAFAQLGNMPGDLTTFWVNLTATAAVLVFALLFAKKEFSKYTAGQYAGMAAIGVAWPLIYSIVYFTSVDKVGAACTSILNYTWPVWYFVLGFWLIPNKISRYNKVFVVICMALVLASVGYVNYSKLAESGNPAEHLKFLPLFALGLGAGLMQGFYSAANDKWDFHPWVMTFVVEAVTLLGSAAFVLWHYGTIELPDLTTFGYLTFIGVISNGIGFWAFLASSKLSSQMSETTPWIKPVWLVSVCFVPFGQIIFTAISGIAVPTFYWISAAIMVTALLFARFADPINRAVKSGD